MYLVILIPLVTGALITLCSVSASGTRSTPLSIVRGAFYSGSCILLSLRRSGVNLHTRDGAHVHILHVVYA